MLVYREDIILIFNDEKDMWEMRGKEDDILIDCNINLISLINDWNCLK